MTTDSGSAMDTLKSMARIPKGGRRPSGFGTNVKRLREARSLTQEELADLAGVARPTVTEIETGGAPNPREVTRQALAKALGVSVSELARATEPNREMAEAVSDYVASPYAAIDRPQFEELTRLKRVEVAQWTGRKPSPESIHHVLLALRASAKD